MALITGGMGGLGMVASYEHAMAGRDKIIAVTRSAYLTPGEQEAHLLDVIQDICTHYVIRCDIADAGAWSDTLAFANNIAPHEEFDPQTTMKETESQLKSMDSLDVIDVLIASLRGMVEAGTPIDAAKLNRILYFRNNMSRGLKETMERHFQAEDREVQEKLFYFAEALRELSELLELFRKRGLVEEQPGGTDPMGGIFPGEAAAMPGPGVQAPSKEAPRAAAPSAGRGSEANGGRKAEAKDSLLELIEAELASKRSKQASQKGTSGIVSNLDSVGDAVPGTKPRGERQGCAPAPAPAPAPQRPAARAPVAEAKAEPEASQPNDAWKGALAAERGALEGAIRRAKEEARLKAQRDAERKAQRQEAERRAKEDAERQAQEEKERLARESSERQAREAAAEQARAEQERRAAAAAAREAEQEAARLDAQRQMREEADRKSLDDLVCPKGHKLQPFTAQRGFPCDLCDAECWDSTVMWGCRNTNDRDCRTCDFDICAQCSKSRSRRALRAKGEAV